MRTAAADSAAQYRLAHDVKRLTLPGQIGKTSCHAFLREATPKIGDDIPLNHARYRRNNQ